MITSLLIRWVVLAAAVELAAWILPGVTLTGGVFAHLLVALLIGLVNALVPLVTARLPQPGSVLLLGLLTLAVNAVLVWVVAAVTPWLAVSGLLAASGAVVLISVFAALLALVVDRLMASRGNRSGQGTRATT
ncbi:phage holin family protein [Kocuria sediminis]|uniref:Phage holin family protein n=1 Tax=Kocuria sediminis TaxID=1038857 RepID=A0A6N8GK66_9MICC|nr:phage holin family protein [Kocuria sediminis]MUN62650.1 phage holin family protein [Kocuria sediminis]